MKDSKPNVPKPKDTGTKPKNPEPIKPKSDMGPFRNKFV
jgi:hypothetical protein